MKSKSQIYRDKYPWQRVYNLVTSRCADDSRCYKRLGIVNELTANDIKELWVRDNADDMDKASIDRIDTSRNYTMDNCRFIELAENKARPRTKRLFYAGKPVK